MRRRPPCRNFGGDTRSQELAALIVERSARISALHREQLADIAEFDRSESWRGDGATSMVTWVTAQCGVSTSTARRWVRSAFNLDSLPCLAEGLASGEMSLDLVEPLAEVASPSSDAVLREASQNWSVQQARDLAAWHKAQTQARSGSAANSASDEYERRTLHFNDRRQTVRVSFTKDDYAAAKSVLVGRVAAEKRESEDRESGTREAGTREAGNWEGGKQGAEDGDGPAETLSGPVGYVPYDKRLYDALIELFQAGIGSGGGSAGPLVRPRVVVHAPLELLVGCSNEKVAEIAGVGPVSAEVVRRLACDAKVDLSVEDASGSILNQGRARREATPAQRVELARRDKGCRFPGCSYKEFTNVHHIHHWVDGGLTNLDNLVTLCGRHHRAVHELGWSVSGNPDATLTFTSPHDRSMQSEPSPTWRPSSVLRSAESDQNRAPDQKPDRTQGRNGPLRR